MSGSGIGWAVCKSAPCSRQITTPAPHHSVFLQAGCPSCRPTTASKHWRPCLWLRAVTLSCVVGQGWRTCARRSTRSARWRRGRRGRRAASRAAAAAPSDCVTTSTSATWPAVSARPNSHRRVEPTCSTVTTHDAPLCPPVRRLPPVLVVVVVVVVVVMYR